MKYFEYIKTFKIIKFLVKVLNHFKMSLNFVFFFFVFYK